MSTSFEFYSRFDAIDVGYAIRALAAERRKQSKGWSGEIRAAILIAALIAIAAIATFSNDAGVGVFLAFLLLIGAGLLVIRHNRNSFQATLCRSPMREGVARVVLSALGMRITHPGYEVLIAWSHMEGLIVTERGLLLLIDGYEYCPIERSAFNDDAHMKEVADQVEAWRAAAGVHASTADA